MTHRPHHLAPRIRTTRPQDRLGRSIRSFDPGIYRDNRDARLAGATTDGIRRHHCGSILGTWNEGVQPCVRYGQRFGGLCVSPHGAAANRGRDIRAGEGRRRSNRLRHGRPSRGPIRRPPPAGAPWCSRPSFSTAR